jgi:hypothetical protein
VLLVQWPGTGWTVHNSYVAWPYLSSLNPLNAELNPICYLLALLGAHHILHVSRVRVKDSLKVSTIELHLSGRWLSGLSIIQIGLALQVNLSRNLQN